MINFTWGYGRLTEFATDFVSIRWEGAVLADHSEDYTFTLVADDSVRLWVDHDLIIDQWHVQLDGMNVSGTAPLVKGQLHHVVLEYREVSHNAYVCLFWSSDNTPIEIVPQKRLYHLHELDESPKEVNVVSAGTSSEVSDCVGGGLFAGVAGQTFEFTVRPRDTYANPRNDDDPVILALDPFAAEARLQDNVGEGFGIRDVPVTFAYDAAAAEFVGTYSPFISGKYALHVTHAKGHNAHVGVNTFYQFPNASLLGSPFTVDVVPAKTFAKRSKLWGSENFLNWHVGELQTFRLRAHDAMDNMRLAGGDKFEAVAYLNRGGASIDNVQDLVNFNLEDSKLAEVVHGSLYDYGTGNYTVTMRPIKKGNYTLAVTLGGHHVAKSPYHVQVYVGEA